MAEITTTNTTPKPGVPKSKKLSTRVDLTPMVDLGFLLITFFIFTTNMSQPTAMVLAMPKDSPDSTQIGNSGALTVFPLADNKIFYYHGALDIALKEGNYGVTTYSYSNGIGNIIRQKQLALDRSGVGRKEMMLIIKPTELASFGNTVNILDEVTINDIKRYALTDMSPSEKEMVERTVKGS